MLTFIEMALGFEELQNRQIVVTCVRQAVVQNTKNSNILYHSLANANSWTN